MRNINKELHDLFNKGQWQNLAVLADEKIKESQDTFIKGFLYRGIARIELASPDIGITDIEKYLTLSEKNDPLAYFYLGRGSEAKKQVLIADSWYEKAMMQSPDTVKYVIYRVVNLFNNKMFDEIKDLSNLLVKNWSEFELFPLILMTCYEKTNTEGEIPHEIMVACAGFAKDNNDPETIKKYVNLLLKYEKYRELETYIQKLDLSNIQFEAIFFYAKAKIAEAEKDFLMAESQYKNGLAKYFNTLNALALIDLLFLQDKPYEAIIETERCLEKSPKNHELLNKLGSIYFYLPKKVGFSIKIFEKAINYAKGTPEDIVWNLSLSLLSEGYLVEGWDKYRSREGILLKRKFEAREWQGEQLKEDEKIMVWSEQGIGDHIMFATALPDLIDRIGPNKIIFETEPRLLSLFQRSFPEIEVRKNPRLKKDFTPYITDYQYHVALGTLQNFFRKEISDYSGKTILRTDSEWDKIWKERLPSKKKKIGIIWRSGLRNSFRNRFYVEIERLFNFFSTLSSQDIEWVNLQYGECEEELSCLAENCGIKPLLWDDVNLKDDFDAVASLIKNLDLVIGPATTPTMLAGALGVPVYMFSVYPEWSFLGQEYYPWFKSVHLYVTPYPNKVDLTLIKVAEDIEQYSDDFSKAEKFNIINESAIWPTQLCNPKKSFLNSLKSEIAFASEDLAINDLIQKSACYSTSRKFQKIDYLLERKEAFLIEKDDRPYDLKEILSNESSLHIEDEIVVIKNDSSKIALLCFQGNHGEILPKNNIKPYLSPKFAGKSLAEKIKDKVSYIGVRDSWQMWYQVGPLGNALLNPSQSLENWTNLIKKRIFETKAEKIICIGSSSGGSAAILFGAVLNADLVISISPQAKPLDLSWEDNTGTNHITADGRVAWRKDLVEQFEIPSIDLKPYADLLGEKLKIIIPKLNKSDITHAQYLSDKKSKSQVYKLSGKGHANVDKDYLLEIIKNFLDSSK